MPCRLRGHWGRKEIRRREKWGEEEGSWGVKLRGALKNFLWEPSSCVMN